MEDDDRDILDSLGEELDGEDTPVVEMHQGPLVRSMEVRGLFARYNYDIRVPPEARSERLLLFYADNGRGKTTVLRLLWHLLSPAEKRSHRTNIAKIVFLSIRTVLSDGAEILISRPTATDGNYTLRLSKDGQVLSESDWPEAGGSSRFEGWAIDALKAQMVEWPDELQRDAKDYLSRLAYFSYLQELQASPYFLADDRNIYNDDLDKGGRSKGAGNRTFAAREYELLMEGRAVSSSPENTQGLVAQELETSLARATEMLRGLTLGATATGSASANSVYLDVLRRLGATAEVGHESPSATISRLTEDIAALGRRSLAFESLSLVPSFGSHDFVAALTSLEEDRAAIAEEVVGPFIASLSARLDALDGAQSLIHTFLDETNGFLADKEITFSPRRGLRIELRNGSALRPPQLSSGERQVILLLCNALLGRRGTRLFLIDEPELSLNAKWQRKIVPALLACTAGTSVQFLIATHSLELLSTYRSNVVTFEELDVELA